jgi:Asp-tRNA(Asn)/Glu-tRNA(Gln) amidotransferase A subunit family amidase
MFENPALTPGGITLRSLGGGQSLGESRYMTELYLRERGDAKIKTQKDLNELSKALTDPSPDGGPGSRRGEGGGGGDNGRTAMTMDNANRWLMRFAVQQIVLQAMEDMHLDAMICPTGNIPPYVLGQPLEPTLNGRGPSIWSFLGTQGFPELGVPAGWTTQVYDRVRDASAPGGMRLKNPIAAKLPLSVMFFGRPFSEPTLFKIASAYESATHHREAPSDFGPLQGR